MATIVLITIRVNIWYPNHRPTQSWFNITQCACLPNLEPILLIGKINKFFCSNSDEGIKSGTAVWR